MTTPVSKLILLCAALASTAGAQTPAPSTTPSQVDLARWSREAESVTITRDDWGIPHISGKTDADAVFGLLYAQAEDDFNRVETNYFNALGRAAEWEGDTAVYRDLRYRLINNPDSLKAIYARAPRWLQSVMNAWADGL
ncbi:MAG: penicillin acylase family protein, partial [Gemmatimonadaceae bacterium]